MVSRPPEEEDGRTQRPLRCVALAVVELPAVLPPTLRPGPATLEVAATGLDVPASVRLAVS